MPRVTLIYGAIIPSIAIDIRIRSWKLGFDVLVKFSHPRKKWSAVVAASFPRKNLLRYISKPRKNSNNYLIKVNGK